MPGRTIAIGDVHGCSAALDALIEAIKPRPEDTVVTLGDYVNRGPDSRGVIDRLVDLGRRCRLVPILGNHEEMLLDVRAGKLPLQWLLRNGGDATLRSYGNGRDLDIIPAGHFDFIKSCLGFYETDSHVFTHANYLPGLPMAEQSAVMLRWQSLRDMVPGPHVSGKIVVVGHSSQKGGEVLDFGHLKCIDTYCYGGGWLTALDVNSGGTWQADREGKTRTG